MTSNDLWCKKCKSQHHPTDCPLDNQNEKKGGEMTKDTPKNRLIDILDSFNWDAVKENRAVAKMFLDEILQWHVEQRKAWALGLVPREMPEKTVCWWLKNVKKSDACVKGYNGFREQMIKRIKGE